MLSSACVLMPPSSCCPLISASATPEVSSAFTGAAGQNPDAVTAAAHASASSLFTFFNFIFLLLFCSINLKLCQRREWRRIVRFLKVGELQPLDLLRLKAELLSVSALLKRKDHLCPV